MQPDFQEQYRRYQTLVEQELDLYFKNLPSSKLGEAMRYSLLLGGKRVRPVLTLATCEMLGSPASDALPAACALEMIHSYSLVHDDLPAMDNDDLRRGKPTNHKVFGDGLAILAGDGLLTESFSILTDVSWNLPAEQKLSVIATIAKAAGAYGMVAGQALDLEHEGGDCTERLLEKIHGHKTGCLLTASVVAGGYCANAAKSQIEKLESFGRSIGLAFQIADDVLDVTSTTEALGKDAKSDLKKNKSTYPLLIGVEQSRQKANQLLDVALSSVASFGDSSRFLQDLARFIVHRTS